VECEVNATTWEDAGDSKRNTKIPNRHSRITRNSLDKMAMPKRVLQGKIYMTRKRGRPRLGWLEDVHDDLRKMKVKGWGGWGGLMKNREEWRKIV
jgi:uncharacterized protein YrrD